MTGNRKITLRKLNYRKFSKRLGAVALILALIVGVFVYQYSNVGAAAPKPSVYIVDLGGSSGAGMETYLTGQQYPVTRVTSVPANHTTANNYDVIIVCFGNVVSTSAVFNDGTAMGLQWAYDQLNGTGNNHRLIIEGDNFVKAIVSRTYTTPYSNTTLRNNLLHATALTANGTYTSPTSLTYTTSTHYIVTGVTGTNPTYTTANSMSAFTTDAGSVASYQLTTLATQPYTALSAWEGTGHNSRLVLMNFYWNNIANSGASLTWRNTVLQQSVDWAGNYVNAWFDTAHQASNANPGTTSVNMGAIQLMHSNGSESDILQSFTIYQSGTATADSNIITVKLYNDANNDGVINAGDTVIASGPLSGGKVTFSGLASPTVSSSAYSALIISFDLAAGAVQKQTVCAKVYTSDIVMTNKTPVDSASSVFQFNPVNINDITPPAAPTGVSAAGLTDTSVRITWNANTEPDLVGYHVYRDSSATGTFTTRVGVTGGTTFDDTGLTRGTTYYYKVLAYDTSNNLSTLSSPAAAGIPNAPPATPTGLNVSNPATGRTLVTTWNANSETDLAGYNLYIATVSPGPYSKVNAVVIPKSSTPGYTVGGIQDNTTYYFKVSAVDSLGAESALSAQQPGMSTDSTPPRVLNVYPAEGQDLVPRNAIIKAKFDDPIDPATVTASTIQVTDQNNSPIPGTVTFDAINNQVEFAVTASNPYNGKFPSAGAFNVRLLGTVKNFSGLALGADKLWTFGTLINPHSNFRSNTTLCGYCHLAHTATGENIIRQTKIIDLCLLCHDGTGSSYDVKGGIYFNGDAPTQLLSGGYDLAMGSTSTHFTDLANFVYGGSLTPMTVDCNNCHEPHGSTNYRNLRTVVNGVPVTVTGVVYGPAYSVKTASGTEVATYIYGINQFCGVCHMDYLVYNSANTRDGVINWRHRVGVGMTGGSAGGDFVISFPQPGLYTTLPTEGVPTGANVNNYDILPGGTLSANSYNYIVTGENGVGESVYGNVLQITTYTGSQKIKIYWEPIANAYKYKIYRYVGTMNASAFDVNSFNFIAEVNDYPASFTDDGSITPTATHPPTTSNAKIMCLTCHFSHGTTAVAEEPTRLRRLNYNGVCEDCHKK